MRSALRTIALLFAALGAAPHAVAEAPETSPYSALASLETRVATIGFRLATANAAWCPRLQPQFGWIWNDPRLYDEGHRSEALAAYGADGRDMPFIGAVAPGSPAALAGLRAGTPLLGIDGSPVPAGEGDDPFARISAVETLFAALPASAPIRFGADDGTAIALTPVAGCASDFRVEARDRPEGAADGRLVLVSAGLAQFADDDSELAAAIAHELAHNILRHRARLDAAGVDRGLGKQFGRSARLFRQTEVEADRLSAWLMAGAGYDPHAALSFWSRFGKRKGPVLFQAGTHPRWRDRVAAIAAEVAAIDAARAAGEPLRPPLVAAPPPLE